MAKRTWVRTVSSAPLTTIYAYNNAGELNSTDYSDSTPDVASTYTRFGAQKTVTDATGTRTFTYTAALRPDQEQLPAFYGDRILTRSYQVGLDLESAPLSVPGRSDGFELGLNGDPAPAPEYSVVYGYDTAGRLDSVTDKNGGYSYTYTSNSNLRSTLTSPVHVATTTYEPYRNVIDIVENTVGTITVSKFDYLVNSLGQRIQRANTGTAFGTTSTDDFTYNAKGEVESATNATLTARNQSFAYDDIGNRLTFTTTGGTTNYTANGLNQYTAIASSTPAYDPDGNQTSTGLGQAYIWDAENRLICVEPLIPGTGDKKVINTYDAQSRRVRRAVFTYTSGAWALITDEKFIYDGWNVVAVLNAASSNALLRTYTWGLDLSGSLQGAGGVGGLLSTKDGSSVYRYTYDVNGNVSEVLDSSGGIAAHYEYDAFGDTFVASGSYAATNEYRFSTKPLDAASGLYYYGFRYYNPSTGRWLSRDPIEENGGLNLYGMVGNNPISKIDPLGLSPCEVLLVIGHNAPAKAAIDAFGKHSCSAVGGIACQEKGNSTVGGNFNQGLEAEEFPVIGGISPVLPSYYRPAIASDNWNQQIMDAGAGVHGGNGAAGLSFQRPDTIDPRRWSSADALGRNKLLIEGIIRQALREAERIAKEKKCDCPNGVTLVIQFVDGSAEVGLSRKDLEKGYKPHWNGYPNTSEKNEIRITVPVR